MKIKSILKSFTFIAFTFLFSSQIWAEEELQAPTQIKRTFNPYINPIGLVTLNNGIGFSVRVSDSFAVGPALGFAPKATAKDEVTKAEAEATAFYYGLKAYYFLSGRALNESGWYLGPEAGIINIYAVDKTDDSKATVPAFSIGTTFGYHWFLKSGISFAISAGGRYIALPSSVKYDSGPKKGNKIDLGNLSTFAPSIELNLGFAF
jgi:hypothetical protein